MLSAYRLERNGNEEEANPRCFETMATESITYSQGYCWPDGHQFESIARVSSGHQRPPYPEKARLHCPRCNAEKVTALPSINPGSLQEWFRCDACDHLWSHRRERREQGEDSPQPQRPPQPPEPPEGEGAGN